MKRPIFWSAIFIIGGIYFRLGTSAMVCLVFFVFCIGTAIYFCRKMRHKGYLLLLLGLVVGFLLADIGEKEQPYPMGSVSGSGTIYETGETSGGNQWLYLRGDLRTETEKYTDRRIYAIQMGEEQDWFAVGDTIRFTGEAVEFYLSAYEGDYDERAYLTTKDLDCKVYLETAEKIKAGGFSFAKARDSFRNTLRQILPATESGIMEAMLTGEKEDIPDDAYTLYTKAGVVHILCISGLHMSALAMYVSFFLEKICRQSRKRAAIFTILATVCYLCFIRFSPSALRAVIMICVVMLGRIVHRASDMLNNIAIAAVCILCLEPRYLFHAGFQLSFLTVLGICIGAERMERKKKKDKGRLDWLKESFLLSFYASVFSFPVVAWHFYSVSLVGILANLVILPLSGLLLGFGILSGILAIWCLPAGIFAAGSVYALLQLFQAVCTLLTKLPFAYFLVGRPSLFTIGCYYLLFFFLLRHGKRAGAWKGAVVLCAVLWCSVFENTLFHRENTVAFLDVGQGDAAVISTYDGKAYLVDGGGIFGKEVGENVGTTVILPYLESLGIGEAEAVFLSHPDTDHMTGLLEVMERIPVKGLYLSQYPFEETEEWEQLKEIAERKQIPVYAVVGGDSSADGAWECLYPLREVILGADDNHGSMVLRYQYGGTKILFTGDIGIADERLLEREEKDVAADILKVAHHGSKYSSSAAFLERVSPAVAVISCGEGNLYGHPHTETLERLTAVSAVQYGTDLDGSVFLTLSENGRYKIETMAERKPFYERIEETMEKP